MSLHYKKTCTAATFALLVGSAQAGPYILAGTDADDHGSENFAGTANLDGWLFMQKALENLAASSTLTSTNRTVVALGSNSGSQAGNAAESAFTHSSLATSGWSFIDVTNLTTASFASSIAQAGIVMLDSGVDNVSGGLSSGEQMVLTANASALNSFVGGGGGLFSQANNYGWLSALVPSLSVTVYQDQGIVLTAAGKNAFPALTDADLSAGPYHSNFSGVGNIPVLGTGQAGSLNIIIGSAGGSITIPGGPVSPVPEPETYALMLLGLASVAAVGRRRKS